VLLSNVRSSSQQLSPTADPSGPGRAAGAGGVSFTNRAVYFRIRSQFRNAHFSVAGPPLASGDTRAAGSWVPRRILRGGKPMYVRRWTSACRYRGRCSARGSSPRAWVFPRRRTKVTVSQDTSAFQIHALSNPAASCLAGTKNDCSMRHSSPPMRRRLGAAQPGAR